MSHYLLKRFAFYLFYAITLLLMPFLLRAQKESAIWYFGDLAGLDFNFQPPRAISNPNMKTFEGCSSISDTSGKLLFYSDGRTVWNKNHEVMENGTGLLGDASSTHSSIFLQKPYADGEYYLITADAWLNLSGDPNNGVNYSVIDINYNNGAGKVVSKNNPLVASSAEKIGVTRHRNGTYFWLAIPECYSSNLHIYLLNENGFQLKATYTNLFPVLQSSWGQIKFSPDGKHLALTWPQPNNSQLSDVMVLDFDNTTGLLNPSQVITGGDKLYGIEFSPNSRYVYLSTWIDKNKVCQCPVAQGTTSYLTDCKFYPQRNVSGQLQLGPDQKIYIANSFKPFVGVIEFPDSEFVKSGFNDSAITLLPNTQCYAGLPALNATTERLFAPNLCLYDTGKFSVSMTLQVYDSLRWYVNNMQQPDSLPDIRLSFSQSGIYDIMVVLFSELKNDTFSKAITVKPLPVHPHLPDTIVCKNRSAVINAFRQDNTKYEWSTGSNDSAITVSQTGEYSVKLTRNGCSVSDTFTLQDKPYPVVDLPDDIVICQGTATEVTAEQPGVTYLWSTGSTDPSVLLSSDQIYWVDVTRSNCTTRDSFNLHTTAFPEVALGNDTVICDGQTIKLNATFPFSTYLWNNTSTQSAISITSPGLYVAAVSNPCGTATDSIRISTGECDCFVWVPNVFTPNGDRTNDLFMPQLSCACSDYVLHIYNRWGLEVYRSDSPQQGWSGKYNEVALPADVYVWQLSCSLIKPTGAVLPQNINGTVTLLR